MPCICLLNILEEKTFNWVPWSERTSSLSSCQGAWQKAGSRGAETVVENLHPWEGRRDGGRERGER